MVHTTLELPPCLGIHFGVGGQDGRTEAQKATQPARFLSSREGAIGVRCDRLSWSALAYLQQHGNNRAGTDGRMGDWIYQIKPESQERGGIEGYFIPPGARL